MDFIPGFRRRRRRAIGGGSLLSHVISSIPLLHMLSRISAGPGRRNVLRTSSRRINFLRGFSTNATGTLSSSGGSELPAHVDLLERYRGLVALGQIRHDDNQLRVLMQLRRLSKELERYSPPAVEASLLQRSSYTISSDDDVRASDLTPWWTTSQEDHKVTGRAVATRKSHAEELATLTTPKATSASIESRDALMARA